MPFSRKRYQSVAEPGLNFSFANVQFRRVAILSVIATGIASWMAAGAILSQATEKASVNKTLTADSQISFVCTKSKRIAQNVRLAKTDSVKFSDTKGIQDAIRADVASVRDNLRRIAVQVQSEPEPNHPALIEKFQSFKILAEPILSAGESALSGNLSRTQSGSIDKHADALGLSAEVLRTEFELLNFQSLEKAHHSQNQLIFVGLLSIFSILAASLIPALTAIKKQQIGLTELSSDFSRLAKVVEKTSTAIVVTDSERKVEWVNQAFLDLSEYDLSEIIGKKPGDLLQSPKTDPATIETLRTALSRAESVHVEILNVSKSGREYWLDLTIDPLFDEQGNLSGFISIESEITKIILANQELERNKFLLEQMAQAAKVGGWSYNFETREVHWSKEVCRIHGVPEGMTPSSDESWSFYPPASRALFDEAIQKLRQKQESYDVEVPMINAQGEKVYTRSIGSPIIENGVVVGMIGSCQDITEIVIAREESRKNEMIMEHMAALSQVGGWELDLKTNTVSWSKEVKRIHEVTLDYNPTLEEALEFYVGEAKEIISGIVAAAIETGERYDVELPIRTKNGRIRWVRSIGEAIYEDGEPRSVRGSFQDVTERKNMTDELKDLAMSDPLTGLPNRLSIQTSIDEAIVESRLREGYQCAVIFLDADRFKVVNDSLGHEMGDYLLKAIGERLHQSIRMHESVARPADQDIAGRLGGDEFVLLLRGLTKREDAAIAAERVLKILGEPFSILGQEVSIKASIGIVTDLAKYESHSDVLRDADTAMYQAKANGKGQFVFFNTEMHEKIQEDMRTEIELRSAISQNELVLHYQPILRLDDLTPSSCEALVRWNHPTRGFLGPFHFMPVAEESDLIVDIGKWVLIEACRQFMEWKSDLRLKNMPKSISVNVARKQLYDPGFVEFVFETIERYAIPPDCLHLEITETGVMQNVEQSRVALDLLRERGVKISLDDFGTGHSALSCLLDLPIDILKLDKSFLDQMFAKESGLAIVEAVVSLSQKLGIAIVAEGIEQAEQAEQLNYLRCNYGQGYLFSRPLAPDAFLEKCSSGFEFSEDAKKVA